MARRGKRPSEFEGVGPEPSTVYANPVGKLSNGERLRLGYVTGVEDDASSPPDPNHFWDIRPTEEMPWLNVDWAKLMED